MDDEREIERQIEPLDYSPHSGAVDPEHAAQDQSTSNKTGRHDYTPNATFTEEQMPTSSESNRTLNQLNRRVSDEAIKSSQRQNDRRRELCGWADQIALSPYEIQYALSLHDTIPTEVWSGYGMEAVALATITFAANITNKENDDTRKSLRRDYEENNATTEMVETYNEIRESCGVTPKDVVKARNAIRQLL